jgi:hypothetical protein
VATSRDTVQAAAAGASEPGLVSGDEEQAKVSLLFTFAQQTCSVSGRETTLLKPCRPLHLNFVPSIVVRQDEIFPNYDLEL